MRTPTFALAARAVATASILAFAAPVAAAADVPATGNLLGDEDGNLLGGEDGNLLGGEDGNLLGGEAGNLLGDTVGGPFNDVRDEIQDAPDTAVKVVRAVRDEVWPI